MQQGRYAHARQFKRARKCQKKLHTILGRVIRDVERKVGDLTKHLTLFNLLEIKEFQVLADLYGILSILWLKINFQSKKLALKKDNFPIYYIKRYAENADTSIYLKSVNFSHT